MSLRDYADWLSRQAKEREDSDLGWHCDEHKTLTPPRERGGAAEGSTPETQQ